MLRWQTALTALALTSAVIAILASIGVLPAALVFAFKPLTALLVIARVWPLGAAVPTQRRLIRLGLALSLVGDVFLLWPQPGFLPGLVAFLLAHPRRCGSSRPTGSRSGASPRRCGRADPGCPPSTGCGRWGERGLPKGARS